MKKTLFLLLVSLSTTLLCGCGTTRTTPLTPETIQAITTRTLDADYARVYKAALSALTDTEYLITNTDYQAGIISGERIETESADAISSLIAKAENTQNKYKITVLVNSLAPERTQVQMTIHLYETTYYENREPSETSAKRTLNASLYRNLFNKISEGLQQATGIVPPSE